MIKLHIRPIKLRRWFPPNDPVAVGVARLCILREDFFLEMMALLPETITELDTSTKEWRRMYFLRNSIRTLFEIRSTIQNLHQQSGFREMLAKQPKEKREKFAKLLREMDHAHKLVKDIRDAISGHVLHSRVAAALDDMSWDRWGFLEIGQTAKDTHYRFAGELLVAVLLHGVSENQQKAKVESDLMTIANLFSVFTLIEDIVLMYVAERCLL